MVFGRQLSSFQLERQRQRQISKYEVVGCSYLSACSCWMTAAHCARPPCTMSRLRARWARWTRLCSSHSARYSCPAPSWPTCSTVQYSTAAPPPAGPPGPPAAAAARPAGTSSRPASSGHTGTPSQPASSLSATNQCDNRRDSASRGDC